jgi:ABC-2 type transport system permease protein
MASLFVIVACLVVLSARTHARLDLTAERLYSLSAPTRALVAALPADRSVTVQAFISREMPEPLVQTRENLLGVLREIEARSGSKLTVTVQDTEPYSEEARVARERYGITPRDVVEPSSGETVRDVYLGVAVTSGADEQVIPFFDRGLSPEYEVARAVRVVTRAGRKRLGVIDTDVRILGGITASGDQSHPAWAAVQELRKQYDVVEVTPASAADAQVDALMVVLPSRMTQTDLDLAMQPVMRGIPTLLLLDPLPLFDLNLAPAADLANQIDPFRAAPAARVVFGNIRQALDHVGINWVPARVAWDGFNPHPDMLDLPQETVFVSDRNGNPAAFNRGNPITASLQELMLLYPGSLQPANAQGFSFEPLVETGTLSGTSSFFDLVVPTRDGMVLNADVSREPDHQKYVLAARVRSSAPIVTEPAARPVDVVAVADLDFISDYFFDVRREAPSDATFDNVTFFLNSIDLLAGDGSFIALRNHRARHRTLERVEAQTRTFMERRSREEEQAERDARAALDSARSRVDQRVADVNGRTDLDEQAKQMMVRNIEETENRQLRSLANDINETKNARIRASRETMEAQVRQIRTRIRTAAVLLPPLPVFAAGVMLFLTRARRERQGEHALRRVRGAA